MYLPRFKQYKPMDDAQSMIDLSWLSTSLTDDDTICFSCKHISEIEDNGVSHGSYTEFCWQRCTNRAVELDYHPYGLLVWLSNGCRSFEHIEIHDCQLYEEKEKTVRLQRGTQIAYIPQHVNDNINHPDVEFGFVTSVRGDVVFCRYWHKQHIGILRTTANSEATPFGRLVPFVSRSQEKVDRLLEELS